MSEDNVEIVPRLFARWERGDLRTAEFFDIEVEHSRIGSELPGIDGDWQGIDEFGVALASYIDALADLHIEAQRIIDLRETGVGSRPGKPPGGRPAACHLTASSVSCALRDGKVLRYDSYWDRAEALDAAGLRE